MSDDRPPLRHADVLACRAIGNVALSPDGDRVAYVVADPPRPGAAPATTLVVAATGDGREQRVGTDDGIHDLPTWSPDGRRLAFAADHDGSGLLRLLLREPDATVRPVGEVAGSVEQLRWSADGRAILVLAADPGSDRAGARGGTAIGSSADGTGPLVRRPGERWRRLHLVDVESGRTRVVGPPGLNVWELDWPGSGPVAAVVSGDPSESGWYDASVVAIDLVDGAVRSVHRPRRQVQSPAIDGDGRIAFVEGLASDRTEVQGVVTVVVPDGDGSRVRRLGIEATSVAWLADGRLLFAAQDGIGAVCGAVDRDGGVDRWWRGTATIGRADAACASASRDGRLVAAALQAPDLPPEVALLEPAAREAGWRTLTSCNAGLRERRTPPAERVAWTASDGLELEGILVRPVDHGDAPLPLVVAVHGGPTNTWTASFSPARLHLGVALLDAGYALLLPNVRGSSGRGQAFAERNVGDMGGGDLGDVLAAIDALVERGLVDRDRVGITGVSYGGFLSAWAPTQCDAFAAAVPVACVSDWLSFHHTTNIPRFDELLLGTDPVAGAAEYRHRSPVAHARRCRTPTLLLHGADDRCTPPTQAQEQFQALAEAGCETELVLYPGAGHGWSDHGQLVDSAARTVAWFDRHLACGPRTTVADGACDG
ncbi:Acylaminoacyl-peptidase [Patulibacter medicamentivorans]|uniref:Acyl-peptide hydrolase n=1 Tax=Patulibacter medicamentivorans TaxID=1097667 RepID=H0E1Q6_9ACTN|nr:S9 family peptidase [Patulibacter medicamentivorans]EHN12399.1 Acylaminoacyl-peptidase [Patulibacter medicamentivorans]